MKAKEMSENEEWGCHYNHFKQETDFRVLWIFQIFPPINHDFRPNSSFYNLTWTSLSELPFLPNPEK
jgi:hypothetical protein